jgi:putative secretion ATPase (PEP-CTERM system associated)
MYASFYQLKDEPFRLSPDPYYCYRHRSYAKAEGYLRYGVERAEGIILVTGVPGTGKSTLISDLLKDFTPSRVLIGTIVVTRLDTDDLFRAVAYALNLSVEGMDRASVLRTLELFLTEQAEKGKRALLIVDEAQNLTLEGLEDLRLLTNLQMGNRPLLQIFLLGQENLREKVQDPKLKQLLQRVIAACHLESLEADETRDYVEQRLIQAGWQGNPEITDEAFGLIHQFSGGIPRRVNQLCTRLFLYGAVDEKHVLDASDVHAVLDDFRKEALVPADEQPNLEEIARAQAHGAYKPRIVTASGRPASAPQAPRQRAAKPWESPPDVTGGRKSQRIEPTIDGRAEESRKPAGRTTPEPGKEDAKPRLQPVASRNSINEALKSLADDEPVPPAARPSGARPAPHRAPSEAGPVADRERPAGPQPSLYADARAERRTRSPAPVRNAYYSNNDERYAHRGHGRSWLALLMAVALLLTSVYLANPFLRDQFGIDIVAAVQEQIRDWTGTNAPNAGPPAQAAPEGSAAAGQNAPTGDVEEPEAPQ